LLVESECNNRKVAVSFLKIILVSTSFALNCNNLLLDFVRISLMSIFNCLKCV